MKRKTIKIGLSSMGLLAVLLTGFTFQCVVGCYTVERNDVVLPNADFVKIPGKDFEVLSTEVTQRQWLSITNYQPWGWMADSSRRFPNPEIMFYEGDRYPASFISYDQALDFCAKLSRRDPCWNYRLPTAEEWEYACKAGAQSRFSFGDDEKHLEEYAWYRLNSRDPQAFHEVAQKKANSWGLYDMHGNMHEWTTTTNQNGRVESCGGSHMSKARECECSSRWSLPPNPGYMDNGFRLFRSRKGGNHK